MKITIVCTVFLFMAIVYADINKLTGQPKLSISIGPYATLFYRGDVVGDTSRPNEQSPAGIVGFGWSFGTPSITVDHKNTVDIGDDNWYWDDGYGNGDEIIHVLEDDGTKITEKFILQKSPGQAVRAIFSTDQSAFPIMVGAG